MKPYFETIGATLYHGDCLEVLKTLPDASVEAIVTDPPAGIGFMGKSWDKDKGGRDSWIAWMAEIAAECLRVIKPGGHALVWALPRTSHWTATAWENAGWEVRDRVSHLFGEGFPKSLDIAKALEKSAGVHQPAERPPTLGMANNPQWNALNRQLIMPELQTEEAKKWQGWGTALKPACEDWWLLRKPLQGTVAANVLKHGTGALNIDGCRLAARGEPQTMGSKTTSGTYGEINVTGGKEYGADLGRWPANVTHDGSPEVLAGFPQTGPSTGGCGKASQEPNYSERTVGAFLNGKRAHMGGLGDTGTAARYFYCAKATASDRDKGILSNPQAPAMNRNHHPTVKNTALMRWLCRLITPPGGTVLDCFAGSGSTGKAAALEGFGFIGIEIEAEYLDIAVARIQEAAQQLSLF